MPSTNQIQQLYITYFERPADPAGLSAWANSGQSLDSIANGFAGTAEYKEKVVNKTVGQVINGFYESCFNRSAEKNGLDFWVKQVNDGLTTPALVGKYISEAAANGPDNSDKSCFTSRTSAANNYTTELAKSSTSEAAYKGKSGIDAGKKFLKPVTSVGLIPSYIETAFKVSSFVSGGTSSDSSTTPPATGGGSGGTVAKQLYEYELTSDQDIINEDITRRYKGGAIFSLNENFKLDKSDEKVTATNATFQADDQLTDASTTDSDTLTITGLTAAVANASVKKIENLNFTGAWDADAVTLFAEATFSDAKKVVVDGTIADNAAKQRVLTVDLKGTGASSLDVQAVKASGDAAKEGKLVLKAITDVATDVIGSATLADEFTGSSKADTINLGGGTNKVAAAGNGLDSITHDTAGSVEVAVTGSDKVTVKATVTGATVTAAASTKAAVIDASTSTHSVGITGGDEADNIKSSAGGGTITGGKKADTIAGGDGIDILVFEDTGANNGKDVITGFTPGLNKDQLNTLAFNVGFKAVDFIGTIDATSKATIEAKHAYFVDLGTVDIAAKDYSDGDFGDLFHADKAFVLTKGDAEAVFVIGGKDETHVLYGTNDDVDAWAAGDISFVATIATTVDFVAGNFVPTA